MLTISLTFDYLNNDILFENIVNIQKELENFGVFISSENISKINKEKNSINFIRTNNIREISEIENSNFDEENILSINNTLFNDDMRKNIDYKNNSVLLKLNNYLNDLNELIINEGFFDNKIFNLFHNQYNSDESINQITSLINIIHLKIREKMDYFKDYFDNHKKGIYQDLGIVIKKINNLENINSNNIEFKIKIEEYLLKFQNSTKKIMNEKKEILNLFDEVKIFFNKFILDIDDIILTKKLKFEMNYINNYDFLSKLKVNIIILTDLIKSLSMINKKELCQNCSYCQNQLSISYFDQSIYNI
jgi:hypothetical protein